VVYQRLPARFRVLDRDADGSLDGGEYAGWRSAGSARARHRRWRTRIAAAMAASTFANSRAAVPREEPSAMNPRPPRRRDRRLRAEQEGPQQRRHRLRLLHVQVVAAGEQRQLRAAHFRHARVAQLGPK
jgi:hypothetical protein